MRRFVVLAVSVLLAILLTGSVMAQGVQLKEATMTGITTGTSTNTHGTILMVFEGLKVEVMGYAIPQYWYTPGVTQMPMQSGQTYAPRTATYQTTEIASMARYTLPRGWYYLKLTPKEGYYWTGQNYVRTYVGYSP